MKWSDIKRSRSTGKLPRLGRYPHLLTLLHKKRNLDLHPCLERRRLGHAAARRVALHRALGIRHLKLDKDRQLQPDRIAVVQANLQHRPSSR